MAVARRARSLRLRAGPGRELHPPRAARPSGSVERRDLRRWLGRGQPGRVLAQAGPARLEPRGLRRLPRRRACCRPAAAETTASGPSIRTVTRRSTTSTPPSRTCSITGGTAFGRLYAIRIAGVLLLALTTLSAWLLAGEVFGRRRLPQLTCAAVAGLMPMVTFMSTAVNPDALLMTLWTLDLWLGARVINHRARVWRRDRDRRGHRRRDPHQGDVVRARARRSRWRCCAVGCRRPRAERTARAEGLSRRRRRCCCAPVLGWVALAPSLGGMSITTVAHLRRAPVQRRSVPQLRLAVLSATTAVRTRFRTTPALPAYDIWVRQGVGTFGWLVVALPQLDLPTAAALSPAAIAVASIALLARLRDRRHLALLGFFALTLVALLGAPAHHRVPGTARRRGPVPAGPLPAPGRRPARPGDRAHRVADSRGRPDRSCVR